MRIVLLTVAFAAALVSAEKPQKQKKVKKVKSPGKLIGANDGAGCFTRCTDPTADGGCSVFGLGDKHLGSFSCERTDCAYGETGQGAMKCDISGISDPESEDMLHSCGPNDGFDFYYLIGKNENECTREKGTVTCLSTCACNSCECNPCDEDETCVPKNGRFGGVLCKKN